MLDLSKITDLGLVYRDSSVESMQRASDVIRSLSDVIINQNESYIQSYISLQTFDNNGDESTSQVRRNNASSVIQQQYRDIRLDNIISECSGVRFKVPRSLITITVNNETYDFGFNGDGLYCTPSSGRGDDLFYSKNGAVFSKPNMEILNMSNQHVRGCYVVGTRYQRFSLLPDGTTSEKDRYIWLWIDSMVNQDGGGWFIPVYAIIKDLGVAAPKASIYSAPHVIDSSDDYATLLLKTIQSLPSIARMVFYLEPSSTYNFSDHILTDTSYIMSNSLYMEWNQDSKSLIPLPCLEDFTLNSTLGLTLRKFRDLPGNIVDWIRNNS